MANEKVLIVDDDASVCKVISRVVASKGLSPFAAASGEEALELLRDNEYDLMVLDLKMGAMDGFEVIERVRGQRKDLPIIILSGNSESYNKLLGLDLGADDYVTKPFDPAFLAAKIQAIIRRDKMAQAQPAAQTTLTSGNLAYNPGAMKLLRDGVEIPLSTKEHAMLRLFMENRGRAFTKEEVYERVWGDGEVDDNAIMVYISRLRGKIEDDPKKPRHILTVWGVGYKFAEE